MPSDLKLNGVEIYGVQFDDLTLSGRQQEVRERHEKEKESQLNMWQQPELEANFLGGRSNSIQRRIPRQKKKDLFDF